MKNPVTGMMEEWPGVYPPHNPAASLRNAMVVDPTVLTPLPSPENAYELIAAQRTGRVVHIYQDVSGMAYANTYPYTTVSPSATMRLKTPITDVYANILSSSPIPGLR